MDMKATGRVYAGGKDTEGVGDGPDSADMKEDVHDTGKNRGITLLSQVLKLLERGLHAMIRRRVEGDFGTNSKRPGRGGDSRRDVRPETDGREKTGGTVQYGSGIRRPGKSF